MIFIVDTRSMKHAMLAYRYIRTMLRSTQWHSVARLRSKSCIMLQGYMWTSHWLGCGMLFDAAWVKNLIGKLSVPSKKAAQHWCLHCSSTLFSVVLKTADCLWVIIALVWTEEMWVLFCLVEHESWAVISSRLFYVFRVHTCSVPGETITEFFVKHTFFVNWKKSPKKSHL